MLKVKTARRHRVYYKSPKDHIAYLGADSGCYHATRELSKSAGRLVQSCCLSCHFNPCFLFTERRGRKKVE